jgi:hypothetical protein
MENAMAKIKLSTGNFDVEFEGEPEFIETKLLKFVDEVMGLVGTAPTSYVSKGGSETMAQMALELSTNTIAQVIGVKTGSDLALAAVAKINLVKNKSTAGRQEILDEMKEATTYFKESYASNLTAYLSTLVKSKRVNLVARGTYALAAVERSRLEDNLRVMA